MVRAGEEQRAVAGIGRLDDPSSDAMLSGARPCAAGTDHAEATVKRRLAERALREQDVPWLEDKELLSYTRCTTSAVHRGKVHGCVGSALCVALRSSISCPRSSGSRMKSGSDCTPAEAAGGGSDASSAARAADSRGKRRVRASLSATLGCGWDAS